MITLIGKGVYGGIAVGHLKFFHRGSEKIKKYKVSNVQKELERYELAKRKAIESLRKLYEKALREIDEESAAIFEIHGMMLEDEDYCNGITEKIKVDETNAEFAIQCVSDELSAQFEAMDDSYMQARGADIRDISIRLIRILSGEKSEKTELAEGAIICADDLTPSETLGLDRSKVLAFVTAGGSVSSHTAILSKSMGIPAVLDVGDDLMTLTDGAEAIVDGFSGKVYISPDRSTLAEMRKKQENDRKQKALLEQYRGLDNVTADGVRIDVFANIQCLPELQSVITNDAGGIGLFRSEFLYLDRKDLPTEEEQLRVYRAVLEGMGGRKVIIRTLDIGADKQADCFRLEKEENPALGLRAIRLCLNRPDVFKPQLRALLRASVYGNLGIMFPMICSEKELREAMSAVEQVKSELDSESIPYSQNVEFGIMIETPAAAVISDILAPAVDFFSIGTNDLSQYTLALDRQNRRLERFFDPHHDAIMRLIEFTVQSAHKNGKWVGICGELGADTSLTERFLRMGIDELSVSPSYILPLRDKIRNTDLGTKGNKNERI